ncbi:aldehyde dehydrogenase family protein [Novosphingobium naphthalenivorans]|uniref:aldehyde dehydrogenase family protein n=1 Tax=Novosphingobium naphthalenivorans TaxID=273168 RepID=UPI0008345095|nr:aldehyde dehydrogenase family protein [Novosphingobium naphthalenivorans]
MSEYNFVAGAWCGAASGNTYERRNPARGEDLVGIIPQSGPADVEAACTALEAGWPKWAATPHERRVEILNRAADLILERVETYAEDLTREEGKTIGASRMEWKRAAANLRLYAGEAVRMRGETYPSADGLVYSVRAPLGVIAVITPWNFPISLPSRKIGPALATGNAVLFKPSEATPLTGRNFVQVLLDAGVPADAIALLQGTGAELGQAIVTAPQVKGVTFTGSYSVGAAIHAAAGPGRRLQLEMGGKNACIVMPDADVSRAAAIIAQGAFNLTGQACTATSRAIIVGGNHDAIVARVAEIASAMVAGDGFDPATKIGPVATRPQYDKVRKAIAMARAEGLELALGSDSLPDLTDEQGGFFVTPTIFADVPASSMLSREEIFGPVLAFHRVESYEEAVALANATDYGLAASIVTNDYATIERFARDIDAGIVKINSATGGVSGAAPFGGIKNSSNQTYREQAGLGVMDFYTTTRTVYLAA